MLDAETQRRILCLGAEHRTVLEIAAITGTAESSIRRVLRVGRVRQRKRPGPKSTPGSKWHCQVVPAYRCPFCGGKVVLFPCFGCALSGKWDWLEWFRAKGARQCATNSP